MDKMRKQIAEEITEKYYNEFSLLRSRYSNLKWSDLDVLVGNDWAILKEYKDCPDCLNEGKVDTFVDFLKEFKFYVQGKGNPWPHKFQIIDYREPATGKLLSEEMIKTLVAALEKEKDGEEADV